MNKKVQNLLSKLVTVKNSLHAIYFSITHPLSQELISMNFSFRK